MTIFDLVFLLAMLATAVVLVALIVLLLRGRFRSALRVLIGFGVFAAVYVLTGIAVSYARPQHVMNVGDSWCFDDWCLAVDQVDRTPVAQDVDYRVNFRIFSRAGRVSQRAKGAWIYVIDDAGRLYPPEPDAAAVPLDTLLGPGESVKTSRTFRVPAGEHELGLIQGHGGAYCGTMSFFVIGDSECIFKRPPMIRIQ